MASKGYDSYLIIGEQTVDWDTPVLTAAMKTIIYEFVSAGLRNVGAPVIPARFKGQPSPARQIQGFFHGEGDIAMHLHAEDMLIWWKNILMATASEVDSTDSVKQTVFADAVWTDPDSLDTQPAATDPTSDPGLLIFTFSAAQTGSITITGTDQNGVAITDTLTFAGDTTKTTTKYFQTVDVDGIDFTDIPPGADTLLIECDKNTYTHVITLGDTVTKGLTVELIKGGIPSTFIGCLLNSGTMDVADVITLTTSVLSKRGWNRYKVPVSGVVPTASVTPTDIGAYTRVEDEVFPAWSLQVTLDDSGVIPVESASFAFNNQLAFPTRFTGVRTEPKPTRSDNRDIALTVSVDYDTVNPDFDAKFYADTDIKAVLYARSVPYAGPELTFEIELPRCQLTQFPDPDIGDYAQVMQELALRPIRTAGASSSDEVKVTIVSRNATA